MGDGLNFGKCAKCGLSPHNTNIRLYRFPKPGPQNIPRCRTWAKFGYPDKYWYSLDFQRELYYECRFLCDRHFKDSQFVDMKTKKLSRYAVPHIDEDDNTHNKEKEMILSEPLEEPKVCRVCLAVDVKMYDMRDFELSEMFQKITGIEITANNHSIMEHLCWECAARLKAAVSFRNKALLSDALLHGLVATGKDIQKTDIMLIKEKYENIKSNLSIHEVSNIIHIGENGEEKEEQSSISEKIDAEIVQNTITESSIELENKKEEIKEKNINTEIAQNIITGTTIPEEESATPENIDTEIELNTIPEESIEIEDIIKEIKKENIETEIIEFIITEAPTYPEEQSIIMQNIDTEIKQNTIPEESIEIEDTINEIKKENIETEIIEFTITEAPTYPEEQSIIMQNIDTEIEQNTKEIKEEMIETEIENDDEPMVYNPIITEVMEVDASNIKKEEDIVVGPPAITGEISKPICISGNGGNFVLGYYHTIAGDTSISTNGEGRDVSGPPSKIPARGTIDYSCNSLLKNRQPQPPMKVLLIVPQIINDKNESQNINTSLDKEAMEVISHDHTYIYKNQKPKNKKVSLFNYGSISKKILNRNQNILIKSKLDSKKIASATTGA